MKKTTFQYGNNNRGMSIVSTDAIFNMVQSAVKNKELQQKANLFGCESIEPANMNAQQLEALESFKSVSENLVRSLGNELDGSAKVESLFGNEAISAAAMALLAANGGDPYKSSSVNKAPAVTANDMIVSAPFGAKGSYGAIAGNERFDAANYAPYRVTTAGLQLAIMNQREYIELAYPTLLIGPTEYGYTLKVPRGTIQQRAHIRNKDGSPKDIQKASIVAQYREAGDTEVTHANRLYPIYRDDTKEYLVDYAKRGVTTFTGETGTTAPIKVGRSCDFIRISLPDGYAEFAPTAGSPSLAPGGRLQHIYLAFDANGIDVIQVEVAKRTGSQFVLDNTNGFDSNSERLNFEATLKFNKSNIKNLDGVTDSNGLKNLVSLGETLHIVINYNATLMLENGSLSSSASKPYIDRIIGANGIEIPRENWTPEQKAFNTNATFVEVDSADFDLRRSNSNLEIFGDIVHVDTVQVHFESAINHPVSVLAAVGTEDSPEILTMVTQAVKLNNHRMATYALFEAQRHIKALATGGSVDPIRTQGLPAGALCYLPAYAEDTLQIEAGMNNEKSGELLSDISGALRAKMKQMIATIMRDSMYVQAVQSSYVVGDKQKAVKIGIITSQFIADFLQVQGDPRLLGDEYEYEIQVNSSKAFDNKIMMFPTTVDNGKTEISPLQFGIGLYSPDVVYSATATYSAQTLREMRLMNRWTPHTLGACMAVLDVSGIEAVVTNRVGKAVTLVPNQNP